MADYVAAGITGVTADNLSAVNAQVLAAATGGADTAAEIQTLASQGALVQTAALDKIANYAGNNPAPTVDDYKNAGITGVTSQSLADVNTQLAQASKTDSDQVSEVQTLVNTANQNLTVITLSANTLLENTTIGTGIEVGALTVTDPDGNGNTGLVLGLSGADAASFAVRSGKLVFVGTTSPDFENKPSYSVTVTSTDGSLVKSQAFTVNVTNVNEVPTAIALSATTFS